MKKGLLLILSSALLIVSCKPEEVPTKNSKNPNGIIKIDTDGGSAVVKGYYEVKFTDVPSATKAASGDAWHRLQEAGAVSMERIFPDAGPREALHHKAGLDRWYRLKFDDSVPVTKAQNSMKEMPGIEQISPVYKTKRCSAAPFNDPGFADQWHYYNPGGKNHFAKGCDINVLPVWENFTTGSKDVIVAVIDEAIELNHDDLAAVCLPAQEGGSRSFMYSRADTPFDLSLVEKDKGHACHVGGTIGAINNNGKGVCGVAGGKDGSGGVRLMSLQVFSGDDGNANNAAALVYAADNGALIANNSWGYVFDSEQDAIATQKAFEAGTVLGAMSDAIDYFCDYAGCDENGNQNSLMKGGLVTFSSGNDGFRAAVPACHERVIAVGAHGTDFKLEPYSNYGDWVDICAPGGSDVNNADRWVLSCFKDNQYGYMAGTSMACPHVSGVAALILSYFGGPGFTQKELFDKLVLGAKAGVLSTSGRETGGMLDAYGAMTFSSSSISVVTDYQGDFTFKSHESKEITFNVIGNELGKMSVTFEGANEGITAKIEKNTVIVNIDALKLEPGDYKAAICVGEGTSASFRKELDIKVLPNNPPRAVGTIEDIAFGIGGSKEMNLAQFFSDQDGEQLSYSVELEDSQIASSRVSKSNFYLNALQYGLTSAKVTAADARGEYATLGFKVLVRRETDSAGNPVVFEIYPNPVSDYLYIRTGEKKNVQVKIFNDNKAPVMEVSGSSSAFEPLKIDVRDLMSGRYEVKVVSGNESASQTQIKI